MPKQSSFHQLTYASPDDPLFKKLVIQFIEVLTGRPKIQKLYNEMQAMDFEGHEAWSIALRQLKISQDVDLGALEKLPKEGTIILIANHPFGVVDGLIMADLASKVRRKFSILVNHVLCGHEARINDFLLPISFDETREAQLINIETKKLANERLKKGEAIVVFPSGGVATSPNFFSKAEDLEWKRFVAKLILQTKATVLPVFVHGKNSRLFQLASQIDLNLRLGLLLNEVRNKMGKEIKLTVGEPLQPELLQQYKDKQELLDFLRQQTLQFSAK